MTGEEIILFKWLGCLIFLFFYAVYLVKMALQMRKGIQTDQMAKGKGRGITFCVELVLKAVTYALALAQAGSVFLSGNGVPVTVRILGVALGLLGDAIFLAAVYCMRDSWRAGIAEQEQTELITGGIYSVSRNPAFLGFDLMYLGLLLMFFNSVLLVLSVAGIVLMHLQILQEEQHLTRVFGKRYQEYMARVGRYLGRKRAKC